MDHCWLITWTCYGHWLPGDARGFVGNVRDKTGRQVVHNIPGTPCDADMPRLERWVRTHMKGRPVILGRPEAEAIIAQYQETARIRQWAVQAASVMHNHTHIVVGVSGHHDPQMCRLGRVFETQLRTCLRDPILQYDAGAAF